VLIREAAPHERDELFLEGYKVWSKNRTFEQYCVENRKEDSYGTRYVMEQDSKILSSLILLRLKEICGCKVYGFGSVLTPPEYSGRGYATGLLKYCIENITVNDSIVFLYSEINPAFYEKFGFKALPPHLQKNGKAVCMALCSGAMWVRLLKVPAAHIPDYF
jgi:predicted acetyltransferase